MTPVPLIVGLGAAAVLAAGLAAQSGTVAGGLVGGLAAFGLLARWPAAPPFVLLLAAYLSLFPDGWPGDQLAGDGGAFAGPRLLSLLTAGAAVVYAAGHYRQLAAADGDEAAGLPRLFAGAAAAAAGGWLVLAATVLWQPDFPRGPLRFVRTDRLEEAGPAGFARFVMLTGLFGFSTLAAALGLWLHRLNRLTPAEARQLLLDTGWRESRRELARLETWRAAARAPRRPPLRQGCGAVGWWAATGLGLFAVTFVLVLRALRS